MAISHLKYVKQLEIGQAETLNHNAKMVYLNNQIDEFKHQLWRHQVDVLLSEHLMKSDNDGVRKQGSDNFHQYTLVIRQMKDALKIVLDLRDQLDKEE